jgi:hypothetical protein
MCSEHKLWQYFKLQGNTVVDIGVPKNMCIVLQLIFTKYSDVVLVCSMN